MSAIKNSPHQRSQPVARIYIFIASNPSESTNPKIDKKLLKIYDARALTEDSGRSPGHNQLTESGGIHELRQGIARSRRCTRRKKKMSAGDFLKGFRVTPGNQFEKQPLKNSLLFPFSLLIFRLVKKLLQSKKPGPIGFMWM